MLRIWMSHGTRTNKSCHAYKWVMSHIWMSHVTYMNKSCLTHEWVMSHMNESHQTMSHVTYEWVTHEWVMSHMNESCHIWMSHESHTNESCHMWMSHVTNEWVMSHTNESCHIWMSHVTYERVTSNNESSCTWANLVSWFIVEDGVTCLIYIYYCLFLPPSPPHPFHQHSYNPPLPPTLIHRTMYEVFVYLLCAHLPHSATHCNML